MQLPDGAECHRGALAIRAVPVRLSIFNVKFSAFEEHFLVHDNRALKAFCFIPVLMNFFPFDVHLEFNRDKTRTMVRLWKRKRCWESTIPCIIRCLPYAAHLAGGSERCGERQLG